MQDSTITYSVGLPKVTTINNDLLESQLVDLDEEFARIPEGYEQEEARLNALPPVIANQIGFLSAQLVNGNISETDYLDQIKHTGASEEFIRMVIDKAGIRSQIRHIQEMLLPHRLEDLQSGIDELARLIDWESVVGYFSRDSKDEDRKPSDLFSNFILYDYGFLLKTVMEIQQGKVVAFEDYEHLEMRFGEIKMEMIKKGLLRGQNSDRSESDLTEASADDKGKAIEDIKESLKVVDYFQRLMWIFRIEQRDSQQVRFLHQVIHVLEEESPLSNLLPNGLLSAIEKQRVLTLNSELETQISADRLKISKELDAEAVSAQVKISGITARSGNVLAVTEDDIREVLRSIPPIFLQKVSEIKKTTKPKRVAIETIEEDEDIKIGDTTGEFHPELDDTGRLVNSEISIYWQPDIIPGASEDQVELLADEFKSTLYHEFGHRIHFELSVSEMLKWEYISLDGYSLTPYVHWSRIGSRLRGIREDFATTFSTFMTTPEILYKNSLPRYKYFSELVLKYMPESQAQEFSAFLRARVAQSYRLISH